jgi:hypothetical protein
MLSVPDGGLGIGWGKRRLVGVVRVIGQGWRLKGEGNNLRSRI